MAANKDKQIPGKNKVEEPVASYGVGNSVFNRFAIKDDYKLLKKAKEGLKTDVFYSLADAIKMPEKTLASVINLSPRTISNYRDQEKGLDPIYSEHLLKLINLYSFGKEIFGSLEEFTLWMNRPFWNSDEKPLYLMYDQIYAMLTFGSDHHDPVSLFPEMKDYTIYVDGTSKCFAATGVRVGWGFGPSLVIDKMKALLTHVGAWAPKPEQEAVAEFLADDSAVDSFLADYKGKLNASLKELHAGIQHLKSKGFDVESISPMGALYLTIKLDYLGKTTPEGKVIENSTDLVFYLINNAGMALVPFSAFGNDKSVPWFRASIGGCSLDDIKDCLPKLEMALKNLK